MLLSKRHTVCSFQYYLSAPDLSLKTYDVSDRVRPDLEDGDDEVYPVHLTDDDAKVGLK